MAVEQLERYLADMLDDQEAVFGYKSEKPDVNIHHGYHEAAWWVISSKSPLEKVWELSIWN